MGTNGKPSAGADEQRGYQFGAFKGVFTPSILTILGVIMYLRMGWVLGNAGLPLTLLIVTMASSITFLTGLSISATATNMQVGGGGAYYIISRSLGVEIGAAIGLPLFMAQSLSVAFYVIGFAEAVANAVDLSPLVAALPFALNEIQAVALITLVVLTIITCISADLALKAQMLILAAIVLSLASFFLGSIAPDLVFSPDAIIPPKVPFWGVFAVFFPAVTGILSGVSMSGDLKEPAKALPRGTLAAVLCGYRGLYVRFEIVVVPDCSGRALAPDTADGHAADRAMGKLDLAGGLGRHTFKRPWHASWRSPHHAGVEQGSRAPPHSGARVRKDERSPGGNGCDVPGGVGGDSTRRPEHDRPGSYDVFSDYLWAHQSFSRAGRVD
jgi:amino acid transporter